MKKELTEHQKNSIAQLQKILKPGCRTGVTKCPGTKRVFTFKMWDGFWMVSNTGINDYSPLSVYSINGVPYSQELGF